MTKNERIAHEAILKSTPIKNAIGFYLKGSRRLSATNLLELQKSAWFFGIHRLQATDTTTHRIRRFTSKLLFTPLVDVTNA